MGNCTMDCVVSKVSLKMLKLALATVKKVNVDSKGKKNGNVINNLLACLIVGNTKLPRSSAFNNKEQEEIVLRTE